VSTLVVVAGLPVENLKVRSLDVESKEITWELGSGQDDPLDYTFEVLRAESPEGPYDVISSPFRDRYIFVDRRIPIGDKYVTLWYKLRCTKLGGGAVAVFGPAAQQPEPDLIAQNIRRLEMTYFTQLVGRSCWLFKKRVFGPRCRTCFDFTMQKRTVDRCLDCFGTGVLRGYHDPIEIWAQIDPTTKSQQNNAQQVAQFVTCTARTSFYPNIQPGDLLVEMENKRWRVQSVQLSERLRAPIKQELAMRQIEERDIEYKLPLRLDRALRDIQPSPVRLFENAADLTSAIENRTSDVFDSFMTYPLRGQSDE
jgi:hypothetical protein